MSIRVGYLVAFLLGTVLWGNETVGQEAEGTVAQETTIDSFAWIAGHWRGEGMGGEFEETWNPPLGNSMVGMFKLVQNDEVSFYEILTIFQAKEGAWMLRLKHFDASLVGWEEKEESVDFPLLSVSETEAKFDGLKFSKVDENTLHVVVRVAQDGKTNDLKFVFKRVGREE